MAVERVRGLLVGGLLDESREADDFLCFELVIAVAGESSASSPEASRDDGWSRSAVDDFKIVLGRWELRFLLPEPADDGEDMFTKTAYAESYVEAEDSAMGQGGVIEGIVVGRAG